MRLEERVPSWLDRLAAIGALPEDPPDIRVRKAAQVLTACLVTALAIGWVAIYFAKGLPVSASIPLAFQVASLGGILYFARTKRFEGFRTSQIALALVLPFALQISLGGFIPSSGVILWASISPLGALMFRGTEHARPWFYAFAAELVVAGVLDPHLHSKAAVIGQSLITTMFVLNFYGVSLTSFLMMRYFVRGRERALASLDEEHRALLIEQTKSERLLLNVLPEVIAKRLKESDEVIADAFDDVTVLFADIAGFTPLSARLPPDEIVRMLNALFSEFDDIAERRGLEKIKTIGDAYMVAGGLPLPRPDHAEAVASAAIDMRSVVAATTNDTLSVRIGIDSGPVVAGVIGRRKFIYDLWGDTVNTASRMESQGTPGGIQVTERTYARLLDRFAFQARGTIDVKGKGQMQTYWMLGRL
ncbi:MAG: adenylate/guanylate cyclase domain-containing protein [Actinomycetota bacterium]|nr:adenylate/guanylate cyclase domain-containing protein [Actinomycetota bacterium]